MKQTHSVLYLEESQISFEKNWYLDDLMAIADNDKSGGRDVLANIYQRFLTNKNHSNKNILNEKEYQSFLETVTRCLQKVDTEYLLENDIIFLDSKESVIRIPGFLRRKLIALKFLGIEDYLKTDPYDSVAYMMGDINVGSILDERIKIRSIQLICGDMHIEGFFSGRQFLDKGGKLIVMVDGEENELEETDIESGVNFFGRSYHKDYTFKVVIDSGAINRLPACEFFYKYENVLFKCPIRFERPHARLNPKTKCNYWVFDDKMLIYHPRKKNLSICDKSKLKILIKEIFIFLYLPFTNYFLKRRLYFMYMRSLYWLTKPKYGKEKIWIYFDKLYKGGDNGEYMFRYAASQNDSVRHYYVINGDAPETKYLLRDRLPVLKHKSRKNKLLVMHADKILSTYPNSLGSAGLILAESLFFSNLMDQEISCIQHGLTIQYMPDIQGRFVDNTRHYFCASEYEIRNLMLPAYDYRREQLHLTGMPRYDELISQPDDTILIAPTWRRAVSDKERGKGNRRIYNPYFKDTEYFRIYRDLINNEKLLGAAKQKGKRIIFLLHPTLAEQKEDFDAVNNETDIVSVLKSTSDVSYETLMRQADIMITDYSGIQYDFAYMKKPVIYYHPETLPPHYDSRVFDYEKDGLGPVIDNESDLVDTIEEYIENSCAMDPKYIDRVDKFFTHHDHANCKRIYDFLIKET